MRFVIWDYEAGGNVEHIEEHGFLVDDVEFVIAHAVDESVSRSSGLPCVFGDTPVGTRIVVVFERIDEDTILPITAYEVD